MLFPSNIGASALPGLGSGIRIPRGYIEDVIGIEGSLASDKGFDGVSALVEGVATAPVEGLSVKSKLLSTGREG
jgi:hypothetical protein